MATLIDSSGGALSLLNDGVTFAFISQRIRSSAWYGDQEPTDKIELNTWTLTDPHVDNSHCFHEGIDVIRLNLGGRNNHSCTPMVRALPDTSVETILLFGETNGGVVMRGSQLMFASLGPGGRTR